MRCFGCYKQDVEGFCLKCRRNLFDGVRVPAVLSFETPREDNFQTYQERTKQFSISGAQLKYSLRLERKQLVLSDTKGQYILKPVPPSRQLMLPDEAPENEHLTMQLAEQVFGIRTAANALFRFSDGALAYVTRRFDVRQDVGKYQQEDFAQIVGRTKKSHGENFKYEGTYEEIGALIRTFVAAFVPVLERFYRQIVFNYLLSNGHAHLRNFSLIRTEDGDYILSPAYDLMCTVLHTPHEGDTALQLYEGDMQDDFFRIHGYYGRHHFEELAKRLNILPKRAAGIIDELLSKSEPVRKFVTQSYLSDAAKEKYFQYYLDKCRRFQV